MADGGNKTEKATPKKVKEAREKGQVAKSPDVNGAVMMCAAVIALSAFGPALFVRVEEATVGVLALVRTPQIVSKDHVMDLFMGAGGHAFQAKTAATDTPMITFNGWIQASVPSVAAMAASMSAGLTSRSFASR